MGTEISGKIKGVAFFAALLFLIFYISSPSERAEQSDSVQVPASSSVSSIEEAPSARLPNEADGVEQVVRAFKPELAVPSDDDDYAEEDNFGDTIQIIGEFEDPDSDANDTFELREQIIGEPIDVDAELDSVEPSQLSLIEDPSDEPGEESLVMQIIGEPEDADTFTTVDDEVVQEIGKPEILPDTPE